MMNGDEKGVGDGRIRLRDKCPIYDNAVDDDWSRKKRNQTNEILQSAQPRTTRAPKVFFLAGPSQFVGPTMLATIHPLV